MADSESVTVSRREIRILQTTIWVSAFLLGGTGAALTLSIRPDAGLAIYGPVGLILMAVPMYAFLRLERRYRDAPPLTASRFAAATVVGALIASAVAFGIEKLAN